MDTYEKRGYLEGDFRLFHLADVTKDDIDFHYHDFDKVIIFIRGNVDYIIEGRSYHLEPFDIVMVHHHQIHRPAIDTSVPYERIIVYFSPSFITSFKTGDYDLNNCFRQAGENNSDVLRIRSLEKSHLFKIISSLEYACCHGGYANELYCRTLFLEFMIHLNRAALDSHVEYLHNTSGSPKILNLLDYIHQNLTSDLDIDTLSGAVYLSKYHMMRLFKQATGYTIGNYINEKRLLMAREMMKRGLPITQVCYDCGFKNYSAFLRAYKKLFHELPTSRRKSDNS